MSYKRVDVAQLMNLQLIIKYADKVQFPPAPNNRYPDPSYNTYSEEVLDSKLQEVATKHSEFLDWVQMNFPKDWRNYTESSRQSESDENSAFLEEKYRNLYKGSRSRFRRKRDEYIQYILQSLQLTDSTTGPLTPTKIQIVKEKKSRIFNCDEVVGVINTELQLISQNKTLLEFVENVESILKQICSQRHEDLELREAVVRNCYKPIKSTILSLTTKPTQRFQIDPEDLFRTSVNHCPVIQTSHLVYNECRIDLVDSCLQGQAFMSSVFTDSIEKRILAESGISPRLTPTILLQYLRKMENPSKFTTVVGTLAVLWTRLQRQDRIKALKEVTDPSLVEHELASEDSNNGYENWTPKDHPEWILLQLELDMMIRPIQVEVAKQMMEMPNGKNGVMQLNMGEGKTSVIIPMLCATLASCDSLVRVTVLESIFATNLKILSFAIGGLLNQRVYLFPCRRDMKIDENVVEVMNDGFVTCLQSRGVILTLPEHRLSFRLKIYDEINKGNVGLGLKMWETEVWLRAHVRDLLDESDELLSVKSQLVYTIGAQRPIDGNELRWKTCQGLLEIVQNIATELATNFGTDAVEFDTEAQLEHPEQFHQFRFLDESYKSNVYSLLVNRLLEEVVLPNDNYVDKNALKTFITCERLRMHVHERFTEITKESTSLANKVLIWAGYIGRGILYMALTKRWRVEYGVDPNGHHLMAVPFWAKDVAAVKTEFGQPDLAIVLTYLSYYYSGLSDTQLDECFESLKKKNDPGATYDSWVRKMNQECVPPCLKSLNGVNLKDSNQRTQLFNTYRKHKSVIDFYLSEKVFPKESKQFPGKTLMNPNELCHERNHHPIAGFSGTNDSSETLPLTMSQQDLPQFAKTNTQLEHTLETTSSYRKLPIGVTCQEILEKMKEDGLRVLIDAGALMLELDNAQVASRWLEIDDSLEATVYFNVENEIVVKTKSAVGDQQVGDTDIRLESSPFLNRLSVCGVFLDDHHTRGTDLNFPTGSRACVTVGTRMRRDKLMQASMRMRKLGNGHSVAFYLSHEAFNHAKPNSIGNFQTSDIITWAIANTKKFNKDVLPYWATAGKNYAQKLAAEEEFQATLKTTEDAKILGARVVNQEATTLKELYGIGVYTGTELLVHSIPKMFDATKQKLVHDNKGNPLRPEIERRFDDICASVVSRCRRRVPNQRNVSSFDEEQEEELELVTQQEIEEERQVRRPPKAEHAPPSLHPNVRTALTVGDLNEMVEGIVRISGVFSGTSFCTETQPDGWGQSVYATQDFATVITTDEYLCTDLHLRPLEYVAVRVNPVSQTVQILILSPFDVNELIPLFRDGSTPFTLHMYSMRRSERQYILINNPALLVPSRGSQVDETDLALACLHVVSGTLYFNSLAEAKAYAGFLGRELRPRTRTQKKAFENGLITTGFKCSQTIINRTSSSSSHADDIEDDGNSSLFECDPATLVKRILACRHPENVNEEAHVINLLDNLKLPVLP